VRADGVLTACADSRTAEERREFDGDRFPRAGADDFRAVPIAVSDPVPTYRRGLTGALRDAGFIAEEVDAAASWAVRDGGRALILTVDPPHDAGLIARLKDLNPELRVLALVKGPPLTAFKDALREGATAAAAWHETPEKVIEVLLGVLQDYCVLPTEVVRALVATNGAPVDVPQVTAVEIRWLQSLADGVTVAELAKQASYSEREMFRLLQRLYRRMGTRTRVAAIVKAARTGLLNERIDGVPPAMASAPAGGVEQPS
jgi:DNA-binding NarL/FixJ family response regulator